MQLCAEKNIKLKIQQMKQNIFILIAVILCGFSAKAQDIKAKAILDAVSAKLKTMQTMKANFALNISKTKETKKGMVSMKGTKYYVNIGAGQEIFCDSKTIYTYNKSANEVTINDFDPNENTFTPTKLFSNFYDKEFKSKFIGEKKIGAVVLNIIELIPTKTKQFSKVEVMIDKLKNTIVSGKIFEKNGNIMSYSMSNMVVNPVLPDNVFVFDSKKYKGVEVVDLR
jgi:outer membrane lipoprotein carrier protein